MNSLKPAFTVFHAAAGLKRLLVVVLAVLLLGVLTSLPALASGSGTWTLTGSLNVARANFTATLLQNGQVLVAGGRNNNYTPLASAELYNPATGTWTTTGSLHTARYDHTATLLSNGQVLVAGGYAMGPYYSTIPLASAELYNPATGTWTTTGSLNTSRTFDTMTLLSNGQVLVAAGEGSSFLTSAELYDPSKGKWTLTGSLNNARDQHAATLLSNGQVLVAGGSNGNAYLASAELYNPSTGVWTTTGSLNTARACHTMTLLSNGQALVVGGVDNNSNALASAELYTP
jgi:N-acetylneuraminic acid mutarotase